MGPPIKGAVKCREIGHFTVHLAYKTKNFSTTCFEPKSGQNWPNQEKSDSQSPGPAMSMAGPYKGC